MRSFITKIVVMLLVISSFPALGQENFLYYKWTIKWQPSALLDLQPSIFLGTEYRPHPRFGVVASMGYILPIDLYKAYYPNSNIFPDYYTGTGLKLKLEPRLYVGNKMPYLAINGTYKYVMEERYGKVLFDCGYNCAYFENSDYRVRYDIWILNALAGAQGLVSKRWNIDFYTGIGTRFRNMSLKGVPPGAKAVEKFHEWHNYYEADINITFGFTVGIGFLPQIVKLK